MSKSFDFKKAWNIHCMCSEACDVLRSRHSSMLIGRIRRIQQLHNLEGFWDDIKEYSESERFSLTSSTADPRRA
jgi:hypothetical protein